MEIKAITKKGSFVVTHEDGSETVEFPGLPPIQVLGVVNCTGKPLPAARETAKRILEWEKQVSRRGAEARRKN